MQARQNSGGERGVYVRPLVLQRCQRIVQPTPADSPS